MAKKSLWDASLPKWEEAIRSYTQRMQVVKDSELAKLDKWYLDELPRSIWERKPPHLTKSELSKLMTWKLKRGKWRPRLQSFVDSLPADLVRETSTRSFQLVDEQSLAAALREMSKLRGVGPATASAILSAYSEDIPFMADEALEGVSGLGPRQYTPKHFHCFLECLQDKAKELNRENKMEAKGRSGSSGVSADADGSVKWTAKQVELALWSFAHRELSSTEKTRSPGLKRKGDGASEIHESGPRRISKQRKRS